MIVAWKMRGLRGRMLGIDEWEGGGAWVFTRFKLGLGGGLEALA